jgi:hypothetical protein
VARIDFSSLALPNNVVELGGKDYEFPGDPPIPMVMDVDKAVRALADAGDDASETHLDAIYKSVLALFRLCDPQLEELPVGPRALVPLALAVVSPEQYIKDKEAANGGPPPAARKRAGTAKKPSTTKRRPTTTRRATSTSSNS